MQGPGHDPTKHFSCRAVGFRFVDPHRAVGLCRGHANLVKIGETTALVAEASTADDPAERVNGRSADTDFPYISTMKALATVGEVDAVAGQALTGWPDGHAAWLADNFTVRVAYQWASYATMSTETYGWEMKFGVKFTGSHLHYIDYDRASMAAFGATRPIPMARSRILPPTGCCKSGISSSSPFAGRSTSSPTNGGRHRL